MNLIRWMLDRAFPGMPDHADHAGEPDTTRAPELGLPALTIGEDGWFVGEGASRVPTRRTQALALGRPLGIVWHWTGTRGLGAKLARRIVDPPKAGQRAASWGTLIAEDGSMIQSAPATLGTWHAGGPTALGFRLRQERPAVPGEAYQYNGYVYTLVCDERPEFRETASTPGCRSANSLFHGVEFENFGELRRHKGKARAWPFGDEGPVAPDDEVVTIGNRLYHRLTDAQVVSGERLARAFVARWPDIDRENLEWTHRRLDPSRKGDPEPTWNPHLKLILDRIF